MIFYLKSFVSQFSVLTLTLPSVPPPLVEVAAGKTEEIAERMYLYWSLYTLYLLVCRVRVTVGDSGLCCCACVTYFER